MGTFVSNPQWKKILHSIAEIWFIIILSTTTWSMVSYLITQEFDSNTFVLALFFIVTIGLLIKQSFQKTGLISLLLGFFLSFASFYMTFALLSEYNEFPTGKEPNALKLIIIGGILVGISFILAIRMCLQGAHKLYQS